MGELSLRIHIEGFAEKIIKVDKNPFVIGRLPECDLPLIYIEVSRYHARLSGSHSGTWIVEDLGSTNGTKLNDTIISAPQKIRDGDFLQIGNVGMYVMLMKPPRDVARDMSTEGLTIIRDVKYLQEQWLQAEDPDDQSATPERAIDRLKELVNIAKALNSAESIEAIFSQVKEVVFRELKDIDRLALLVDVTATGKLELLNAAGRDTSHKVNMIADDQWISHTICQAVFSDQIAIKTANAQVDDRFQGENSILAKGICSALAVPLWDENKIFGVLYADAPSAIHDWHQGGEEDLSFFSTLANLVASAVQRWLLTRQLRQEETIRRSLERYHSPSVVQQMMKTSGLVDSRIVPAEFDISILFADIVGFTALSERLSPKEISSLLNAFFEEMLQEVFMVGGTLDKFIGDCIMAFFGAPEPQVDHALRATQAAQGMLRRLARLNAHHVLSEPLELRIAVNSGKAVVGDLGSSQRVDYTALGGTINLASRMEGICPPGKCVVSEVTYNQLDSAKENFQLLGEHRFKGIDRPILIYESMITSSISLGKPQSPQQSPQQSHRKPPPPPPPPQNITPKRSNLA